MTKIAWVFSVVFVLAGYSFSACSSSGPRPPTLPPLTGVGEAAKYGVRIAEATKELRFAVQTGEAALTISRDDARLLMNAVSIAEHAAIALALNLREGQDFNVARNKATNAVHAAFDNLLPQLAPATAQFMAVHVQRILGVLDR